MDDKVDITDSEFMALCAEMDRLCDNNDLDGIISLCKTFEGKTHRSAITRMYIFYNTATGYAIEHRSFKLVDGVCYRMSHDSPLQLHYEEIHQKELRDANEELRSLKMTSNSLDDDGRTLAIHLVEKHIAELNADLEEKRHMSSYSLTVGIEEFERLTIKLLTLAKDATIYLSLAVYHEERKKPRQPKEILLPRVVPRKNDWL